MVLGLQYGAFDTAAVDKTAAVLPWYLLAMAAVSGLNLTRNVDHAFGQDARTAVLGGVAALTTFLGAGFLVGSVGHKGIAVAYAICTVGHLAASVIWIALRRNSTALVAALMTVGKAAMAALLLGLAARATCRWYDPAQASPTIAGLCGLVASATYAGFAWWLLGRQRAPASVQQREKQA